jgi:hypothetical protein
MADVDLIKSWGLLAQLGAQNISNFFQYPTLTPIATRFLVLLDTVKIADVNIVVCGQRGNVVQEERIERS